MGTTRASARALPVVAAVTVLAVLLGIAYVVRQATHDGAGPAGAADDPPRLHLSGYRGQASTAADQGANHRFRLTATLPDGPSRARVRWLTSPSADDVTSLARALGVLGRRSTAGDTTTYASGHGTLRVQGSTGGQWQYVGSSMDLSLLCPPHPTTSPQDKGLSVYTTCAPMPPPDRPIDSSGDPTDRGAFVQPTDPDRARAVAEPVLAAVGLDAADARTDAAGLQTTVAVDPEVEGLPTAGFATSVAVSGHQVLTASGWSGGTRAGVEYPVISARTAWRRLTSGGVVGPLLLCRQPSGPGSEDAKSGDLRTMPPCGAPSVVTGAAFGLSLQHDGNRPVLVPSWLFTVRGSSAPVAVVAVADAFIATPGAVPGSGGTGSSPGSIAPSAGTGSAEPGTPVDPAPGSRFTSVRVAGRAVTAQFYGGVEHCFGYALAAREQGDRVLLSVVERREGGDQPCEDLAQQYERTVQLRAPLGSRTLIDAETGTRLN